MRTQYLQILHKMIFTMVPEAQKAICIDAESRRENDVGYTTLCNAKPLINQQVLQTQNEVELRHLYYSAYRSPLCRLAMKHTSHRRRLFLKNNFVNISRGYVFPS